MAQTVKCLQCVRPRFNPWVGKISWRRKWQPTPVFLPGISLGQRNLVGYSPWGHKESDMTERLHFHNSKASILWHSAFFMVQLSHFTNPQTYSFYRDFFPKTIFKIVGNKSITKILSSHYMPAPPPTPTP